MDYRGPVTVITESGDEIAGHAELHVVRATNLKRGSWRGRLELPGDAFDLMGQMLTLRLPNGREGQAAIVHDTISSSSTPALIKGSGEPPC